MRQFSANPTEGDPLIWYVWDIYEPLPPKPVFFGTMENAGLVADALNAREFKESKIDVARLSEIAAPSPS